MQGRSQAFIIPNRGADPVRVIDVFFEHFIMPVPIAESVVFLFKQERAALAFLQVPQPLQDFGTKKVPDYGFHFVNNRVVKVRIAVGVATRQDFARHFATVNMFGRLDGLFDFSKQLCALDRFNLGINRGMVRLDRHIPISQTKLGFESEADCVGFFSGGHDGFLKG